MSAAAAMLPLEGTTPSAGLEPDGPELRALFAECACCEALEVYPSTAGLPAGWRELTDERAANGKAALCPDCRSLVDEPSSSSSPTPEPAGFAFVGFRLTYQTHLVAGLATIRLHGGERPRPGNDLPATFLADRGRIQQLIAELQAIDAILAKQGV